MNLPRFVLAQQNFPNRAIRDIGAHVRRELGTAGFASQVRPGARIAIGVGSRGISNIVTIVKSVVEFWQNQGAEPFVFPAMGSHGAATAEGQADVLAHYGLHEATLGVPVLSSLDVVSLGKTPEGIETFLDRNAFEADAVFLVPRVKWHTDFSGDLESGFFKMMAIGLGKFSGAANYHTHAYRMGLEKMIRSVGRHVFASGKILGGLAIQEGAHHETAGLVALNAATGVDAVIAREEELLREVKSWKANLPAPEIDILILDEIGKNISGAGMDTKVANRSVYGESNPYSELPRVHRIYLRDLSEHSYGSAIGIGMADAVHSQMLPKIDWKPTYINSLTASTPGAIKTPIHFGSDREALDKLSKTVGRLNTDEVTYCRIRNTLELVELSVSENLVPLLDPRVTVTSDPFEVPWLASSDLGDFVEAAGERPVAVSHT